MSGSNRGEIVSTLSSLQTIGSDGRLLDQLCKGPQLGMSSKPVKKS